MWRRTWREIKATRSESYVCFEALDERRDEGDDGFWTEIATLTFILAVLEQKNLSRRGSRNTASEVTRKPYAIGPAYLLRCTGVYIARNFSLQGVRVVVQVDTAQVANNLRFDAGEERFGDLIR